jgi:hypothetical protein
VTVSVEVPNGTGVTYNPSSFNLAPSQIVPAGFDTITWVSSLGAGVNDLTLTWQSVLTNLQPGESRAVTLGATVDFSSQGTPGSLALPGTAFDVARTTVLYVNPTSETVQPGAPATYNLTVTNPTRSPLTYNLSVVGVPARWVSARPGVSYGLAGQAPVVIRFDPVSAQASISAPALGQGQVPLVITSDPGAVTQDYGFTVVAAGGGFADSVRADLVLQGQPVLSQIDPDSHGLVASLTPPRAAPGRRRRPPTPCN